MIRVLTALALMFVSAATLFAQDTLPKFTVNTRGANRIFISWTNNFPNISQISIQRSLDSTKGFKTILTVPDPRVKQNGFVDTKAQTPYMFYRLFIVKEGGEYIFSKSSRPVWDTSRIVKQPVLPNGNGNGSKRVVFSETIPTTQAEEIKEKLKNENSVTPVVEKVYILKKGDNIIDRIPETSFKKLYDSVVKKTRDTLVFKSVDTILLKSFVPKVVYKPSQYVYTERDGNVVISLPDATRKQYSIKFFEENETEIFEIKQVKEPLVTLDKSNFLHSGWFQFELYEDGKLKERHKFFIPKDF